MESNFTVPEASPVSRLAKSYASQPIDGAIVKVFVVQLGYRYEDESLLRVFASLERAKSFVDSYNFDADGGDYLAVSETDIDSDREPEEVFGRQRKRREAPVVPATHELVDGPPGLAVSPDGRIALDGDHFARGAEVTYTVRSRLADGRIGDASFTLRVADPRASKE